jgi:hypothetical protein
MLVNDARIDERRGFGWHTGSYPAISDRVNEESAHRHERPAKKTVAGRYSNPVKAVNSPDQIQFPVRGESRHTQLEQFSNR